METYFDSLTVLDVVAPDTHDLHRAEFLEEEARYVPADLEDAWWATDDEYGPDTDHYL
jgi:hypothetical protein